MNLVFNDLTAPKEVIEKYLTVLEDGRKIFDFNKIIPLQEDDWNYELWGTNRNSFDLELEQIDDNFLQASFTTAWSPPEQVFLALVFKNLDCDLRLEYDIPEEGFKGFINYDKESGELKFFCKEHDLDHTYHTVEDTLFNVNNDPLEKLGVPSMDKVFSRIGVTDLPFEMKCQALAISLNAFYQDYDPYDYMDNYGDDSEGFIHTIENDLKHGHKDGILDNLKVIIDDDDSYEVMVDEAKNLFNKVQELAPEPVKDVKGISNENRKIL